MLERDFRRGMEILSRVNLCPLGSAAFASTGFKLDREFSADLLGFDAVLENSVDAVSSRDFIIESLFLSASIMLNLSRIAEEIIIWSSEFGYIELPDEFASTSSIMPQKKNPDVAELIRAKTGTVIGHLMGVMSIYKALPFSYNRDLQEMNPHILALNTAIDSLRIMGKMMKHILFRKDIMQEKAGRGYSTATEIADTLVRKCGIPFRIAHRVVGKAVASGKDISVNLLEEISREIAGISLISLGLEEKDILDALDPKKVVEGRKNIGGTSTETVDEMISSRYKRIKIDFEALNSRSKKIEKSMERLKTAVRGVLNGG